MATLVVLFCQALDVGVSLSEDWPTSPPAEWAVPHAGEDRYSVEAYAVYTRFDQGIRLDNGWGFGGDLKVSIDWGTPARLVVRAGYAGWSTENDDSQTFPGHTDIGQYRIGVGGDFGTHRLEFGIYANFGLYHFHTRHVDNDTAPFFELQATAGFKPLPYLKFGLTGMVTWVNTNFNRASTHLWVNESIGPAVEVKFDF